MSYESYLDRVRLIPYTIDLSTERNDEEWIIQGKMLYVISADGTLYVKVNDRASSLIDLSKVSVIRIPFERLFLTNTAQEGKSVQLIISNIMSIPEPLDLKTGIVTFNIYNAEVDNEYIEYTIDYKLTLTTQIKNKLELSHIQNTDQYLDYGGINQVSAEELRTAVDTYVSEDEYKDIDVLNKIKNVDGSGSGLDADLLDGEHATSFASASHTHLGSDITSAVAEAVNSDKLDNYHASDFASASHNHDSVYLKLSIYDTNSNNIVDKAESIDDGLGNSATASQIKTAVNRTPNYVSEYRALEFSI